MNPEFQRNLWLELPPHRLVAMPAVLVLAFFAAWLAGGSQSFAGASQLLITLLLIVWGGRLAAESVLTEVIGNTWDAQRMSAITPWEMAWGKLLGSTAFMWYGSLWCLIAFLISPHGHLGTVIRLLLAGAEAQALALVLSMMLIRGEPANLRFQVTVAQSLTVVVMLPFLFFTVINRPELVHWYGATLSADGFIALSQLLFIGWTVLGVYQLMRGQLQYPTRSVSWLLFVVFAVVYLAGFDHFLRYTVNAGMPTQAVARLYLGFCAAVGLTYVCALVEPKSPARLMRWLSLLGDRRMFHGARTSPTWVATLGISLLIAVLTVVNIIGLNGAGAPLPVGPLALILAVMLFAVRDLAAFHYLVLSGPGGRGSLAIAVYLLGVYFMVPVLLSSLRLDFLLPLVLPTAGAPPLLAVLPALVQTVVALVVVKQRWGALRAEAQESQGVAGH
ncbi:MAG: hypothetical protein WCO00_02100 [Rhodospirillaceae bacterium]